MAIMQPITFVLATMLRFLAEDRRRYFIHLPIVLITETGELLPPFLNGVFILLLMRSQSSDYWLSLAAVITALATSRGMVAWLRLRSKRILGQIALNCRYRARVGGFERLVGFSMIWHHQESVGNKVQRLITGADAVRDWGNFHNEIAQPLCALLGVCIACAYISPWFVAFGFYFVLGMALIEIRYDRKLAQLSVCINSGLENAIGTIVEGATNMLTIKAAGAGTMVSSTVEEREAHTTALGHARVALNARKALVFHVHIGIAFGIFLMAIAWATLHQVIAVGFVVTYLQYFNSLRSSANAFTDRFQTMVERYADLVRLMPLFSQAGASTATASFPENWREICVRELHYAWGDKLALRGVSFSFSRGERIGVTGASGSGKSSLVKLLLGLYVPSAGRIEIGGVCNQLIAPEALAQHMAVVLQEVELFNVSLRDNITLLRVVDVAWFEHVCHVLMLDTVIARLPQGADTLLGERGYSLSGGERQRVGIARALYRQPDILILDEATSALDDATEDHVMRGILSSLRDDAVLIAIAHRTRSLREMQRILYLENGQLQRAVLSVQTNAVA